MQGLYVERSGPSFATGEEQGAGGRSLNGKSSQSQMYRFRFVRDVRGSTVDEDSPTLNRPVNILAVYPAG